MEVLEAIRKRTSIRAFRSDEIPKQVFMDILDTATRAASGVNLQPWEFFVVRGQALKDLKRANLESHRLGKPPCPEIPVGALKGVAPALEGVYRERQVELAKQIFQILHISREDKKKQQDWNEQMVQFYDAPAVIVIVMDKMLQGAWPILDIGCVTQNLALVAQGYGLGTCIMRAIVDHPEQLRSIVGIPDSKQIVVGVALGYPDWDHPINQLRTNRERLERIVTFVG